MNTQEELIQKYKAHFSCCLGTDAWTLTHVETKTSWTEKLDTGTYALKMGDTRIASFQLVPMINCCGICVSTRAEVSPEIRGRGLGTLLNSFRVDLARLLGYGVLMCTDVEDNEPQRKILLGNGWKDIHKFVNPRTKNTVFVSVINL